MAKIINYVILAFWILLNTVSVSAVKVVQSSGEQAEPTNTGARAVIVTALTIFFIALMVIAIISVIAFVLIKIYQKLTESSRKKRDFLYYDFLANVRQCHSNTDPRLKWRNWKKLWIFFKRRPVYLRTSEGLEIVGFYNGESPKKENFYMINVYNKIGILKYMERVIIIPNSIKNTVMEKYDIDKTKVLVLNCEGIDNVGQTDYYYIPLVKDDKNPKEFLDFADMIHNEYIEKIVYRDLIKENLLQYREGVIKSVESNPNVHFNRRNE